MPSLSLQFSSRDYKGKAPVSNPALRIPTWASEHPSKIVFPPSYRQQTEQLEDRKSKSRPERPRSRDEASRQDHSSTSQKRRRPEDDGREQRRDRLPSQPLYRPSVRRRSEGSTVADRRGSHHEAPLPAPPPPPSSDSRRDVPAPYTHHSQRPHQRNGSYNEPGIGSYITSRDVDRHRASHGSSNRRSYPPRHQSNSRLGEASPRAPHKSSSSNHSPAPVQKQRKDDGEEKNTLDLFISAGFGQGFAAAPKVLGDLFESIIGAVYIDSGGDLEALWKVSIYAYLIISASSAHS